MGFYIRKSLKAGPFRFNISKSGIGISAGIPGFRVGTGPRGNYVYVGRKGYYYQTTLPSTQDIPVSVPVHSTQMKEIDSVEVHKLRDTSSNDLIDEINEKNNKITYWPIVLIIFLLTFFVLIALDFPAWFLLLIALIIGITVFIVYQNDQSSKTVVLFYDLDEVAESAYLNFHKSFHELQSCNSVWHISASGNITNLQEWKRQAGASKLVHRNKISLEMKSPPFFSTNILTPSVPVGNQTLYFFPDRVLVFEGKKAGAVSYENLTIEVDQTRFIESEQLPGDAKVVDSTWQYVNKNGGPDRRYRDNRQLPIALYSEIYLRSKTGLNELIQVSKPDIGGNLKTSISKLVRVKEKIVNNELENKSF